MTPAAAFATLGTSETPSEGENSWKTERWNPSLRPSWPQPSLAGAQSASTAILRARSRRSPNFRGCSWRCTRRSSQVRKAASGALIPDQFAHAFLSLPIAFGLSLSNDSAVVALDGSLDEIAHDQRRHAPGRNCTREVQPAHDARTSCESLAGGELSGTKSPGVNSRPLALASAMTSRIFVIGTRPRLRHP